MNVSAIIVTRGNVDLEPVLDSLPWEWEIVIWDNSYGYVKRQPGAGGRDWNTWVSTGRGNPPADLSVYGRYAAIAYASHDLIYVQDDDVIVSDPQAIVDIFLKTAAAEGGGDGAGVGFDSLPSPPPEFLVANMPQEFRHDGYTDSCLVGFGACFQRDLWKRAIDKFVYSETWKREKDVEWFYRCCDVVMTTLTQRVLVDVPITHREFASDPGRMWKQPNHVAERARMLELARKVRDA